jgi:hypothetical protein
MFHFPTFPPTALYIQAEVTGHDSSRVSPFGHPWITARLPAPQGFSQAPTSFIGFWCQDIHRVPLLTWPHKTRCSRPLCSSQGTGGNPGQPRCLRRHAGQFVANQAPTETPEERKALGRRSRRYGFPFPQDPTACQAPTLSSRSTLRGEVLARSSRPVPSNRCSTHELPRQNVCLH